MAMPDQKELEKDAIEILEWAYGLPAKLHYLDKRTGSKERIGQAFMNTLYWCSYADYMRLNGSLDDPFYNDYKLPTALDRLTSK
ncbi:MAG: hypothetical protein ACJ74Y_14000 [Bryobacteraceae bacterium]|jgi:hypothetical protein